MTVPTPPPPRRAGSGRVGPTRTLHPRLAVALVAVLALVAVGAWWRWLRASKVQPGVVFVGDSVTALSLPAVRSQLGKDQPVVLARVGYRSEDLLPLFRQVVDRRLADSGQLREVVVLVGYNDVLKGPLHPAALPQVVDLANRFDCAVWLTLPPIPARHAETAAWNREVRRLAATRRHVHVVDAWAKAVAAAPPNSLITAKDGIHPLPAGSARLVSIMRTAIDATC